jgi:hypothetical protein
MLDLITPAENYIMRISQNSSDISGLMVRCSEARPQIADALRIASTFDMIGIDRARFTPKADRDRATSDQGTAKSLRVRLDGLGQLLTFRPHV